MPMPTVQFGYPHPTQSDQSNVIFDQEPETFICLRLRLYLYP